MRRPAGKTRAQTVVHRTHAQEQLCADNRQGRLEGTQQQGGASAMNWIKDLLWDKSLSVRDNLATWALGIIGFSMFYVLLFLVLLLGEAQ